MRKICAALSVLAMMAAVAAAADGIGGADIVQPQEYPGYCNRDWKGAVQCFDGSDKAWPQPGAIQSVAHILTAPQPGASEAARHHCGAVLVAPDWALTAAGCVADPRKARDYQIGIGFADHETGAFETGVARPIEEIVIHPDYRDGRNDLALVRFAEHPAVHIANPAFSPANPMTYGRGNLVFPRPQSAAFPPAGAPDIPFSDIADAVGARANVEYQNALLYRWSRTGAADALTLWATPLFEMPRHLCNQLVSAKRDQMHENVFCALSHERPLCASEAGAPVLGGRLNIENFGDENEAVILPRELVVAAVAQWRADGACAAPGEPGRYTYVKPYVAWIRETLADTYERRKKASVPFSNLEPRGQ